MSGSTGSHRESEGLEDHQDLVPVVVGGHAEGGGPAADLSPAEPAIKVLQSHASPNRKVELFEAHLVAGDLPEPTHQLRSDATATVRGMGLEVVDGGPVANQSVGVAQQDHPAEERVLVAGQK
jgi:hypothetical protein